MSIISVAAISGAISSSAETVSVITASVTTSVFEAFFSMSGRTISLTVLLFLTPSLKPTPNEANIYERINTSAVRWVMLNSLPSTVLRPTARITILGIVTSAAKSVAAKP